MEAPYIIIYIIFGGFLGSLSVAIFHNFKPAQKKDVVQDNYQAQIDSLRMALHEAVKEIKEKSPMRISRVENKELFDRIEALEKAERCPAVRHEHYYMEAKPKAKKEKPLGEGVSALFPNTEL